MTLPDGSPLTFILMFVLICFSAFFSASETAFTSFNRTKMKNLAAEGNKKAASALKLAESYDKVLSTLLVGNNIVNIALSAITTVWFIKAITHPNIATFATAIAIVSLTVIILIFGEISPNSLAKDHAEGFSMAVAPLLRFIVIILTPINLIFMLWKKLLTKMFKAKTIDTVTEGEVLTLIDEAHEDGSIDEYNKELIENIFDFDDLSAGEIATHRTDLTFLDYADTMEEWDNIIINSRFSRYPICKDSIDNIIGILDARSYLRLEDKSRENVMETIVSSPYFVPEAVKADVLFKNMREHKESMAVVLDEYGGLFGVITMTDLIECIVGDINNEAEDGEEELPPVELIAENSWRILGSASIDEVEEALGVKLEDTDSDTFSGYTLAIYGSVPDDGTNFELTTEKLNIVIEEIKDHRIDRATVSIKQYDDNEESTEEKAE